MAKHWGIVWIRKKIMRKRIYEIIEVAKEDDKLSKIYDIFMMLTILISIVPLAFTFDATCFKIIEIITFIIFILDYILRVLTADYKLNKGKISFLLYLFTPLAIIDLLSILPSISFLNNGWKILKLFRMIRTFRVFKAVRYSKNIQIFINVFKKQKDLLITIFALSILYILISALIVLNIEPETFGNYFKAVYWATVSLTTMGYGDIYPVSIQGQVVTILSSFVGIAIIAMPAGIITAGFMDELKTKNENKKMQL